MQSRIDLMVGKIRRRFALMVGLLGLLVVSSFFAMFIYLKSPINQEYFAKIKRGMTEVEVEAILGLASETHDMTPFNVFIGVKRPNGKSYAHRYVSDKWWNGRSMTIRVQFVEGGTVARANLDHTPGLLTEILRSLGIGGKDEVIPDE